MSQKAHVRMDVNDVSVGEWSGFFLWYFHRH